MFWIKWPFGNVVRSTIAKRHLYFAVWFGLNGGRKMGPTTYFTCTTPFAEKHQCDAYFMPIRGLRNHDTHIQGIYYYRCKSEHHLSSSSSSPLSLILSTPLQPHPHKTKLYPKLLDLLLLSLSLSLQLLFAVYYRWKSASLLSSSSSPQPLISTPLQPHPHKTPPTFPQTVILLSPSLQLLFAVFYLPIDRWKRSAFWCGSGPPQSLLSVKEGGVVHHQPTTEIGVNPRRTLLISR